MGIKFRVADLQRQLKDIESIARKKLDRGSEAKLTLAADQLDFIVRNGRTESWQIDPADPLRTKPSFGNCERDGRGLSLQGHLSFIWTLRRAGKNIVELVDKASTVITIHEVERDGVGCRLKNSEDEWLQKWNIDVVTDVRAPGPEIHAQVENRAKLPVPRLPTLLFSPADCLDFFLGELFQIEWPQQQSRHSQTASFAADQQKRLQKLLHGHLLSLDEIGTGSAWNALKTARLHDDVFITQ